MKKNTLEEYCFLKVYQPQYGEEYEVTKEAITWVKERYKFYNEYSVINRKNTSQITMPGYALTKNTHDKKDFINIASDVITTSKAFDKDINTNELDKIYRTIGNFIPIPEAANYGGGRGKSENFQYKLERIKKFFDMDKNRIISEEEMEQVSLRLKNGITLRARGKKLEELGLNPLINLCILRYWLYKEWIEKGKGWNDFVDNNLLQDFVNQETYNPIEFDRRDPYKCMKLIIKRGYRIQYGEIMPDNEIKKVMDQIKQ